ncbi:VOC family protein [Lyngbya sp. PCC 8106]|uniref:VOC family protein n=1 Tax=Lyngbya sp. (strain PCC 8106) TaxID=313612 RepID=UPI0000EACBE7|nr:VOC family protein [Lyngbya sp. PCC 8106]EAW37961.1 Glyoxalase/bleomycin resistance protein/dioxygenase [Lyngbya sp. PCC 8106]
MVVHCIEAFVTLAATDLQILVEFYRQFLGIEPQSYIPKVYAEFQLPGLKLGIFQPNSTQVEEFADQAKTGMSLCLEVANLDGAIAELSRLGYPPPGEILTASHGREIYAYDPVGNRIILHQSSRQDL